MNTAIDAQNPELEYRASMQRAALGFMQRHQAEHLGNDQLLFTRAVTYLQSSLEVPVYLAETLTGLAYGELRTGGNQPRLDLTNSSESVAVFAHPASGQAFAIPVTLILQRLVDIVEPHQIPPTN